MELKIGQEAEWPAAGNICLSRRTNTEEVTMLQDSPTVGPGESWGGGERGGFQVFSWAQGRDSHQSTPSPGSHPPTSSTHTCRHGTGSKFPLSTNIYLKLESHPPLRLQSVPLILQESQLRSRDLPGHRDSGRKSQDRGHPSLLPHLPVHLPHFPEQGRP